MWPIIIEHINIGCMAYLDSNFFGDLITCIDISDHLREASHAILEAHCYLSETCQSCRQHISLISPMCQ
jgi:hypothetical protein